MGRREGRKEEGMEQVGGEGKGTRVVGRICGLVRVV